jgi:plasmid stabilization system protein ParE
VPQVVWLPESLADVERLYAFLQPHNPAAAARAARVILAGGEQLLKSPQMGKPLGDGTGRRDLFLPFGAGAYVLRYMFEHPDKAVILRVWHDRENRQHSITPPAKE